MDCRILPAIFTARVTVFAEPSGGTNAEMESRQGRLQCGGRAGAMDVYLSEPSLCATYCGWVVYGRLGFQPQAPSLGFPCVESKWRLNPTAPSLQDTVLHIC